MLTDMSQAEPQEQLQIARRGVHSVVAHLVLLGIGGLLWAVAYPAIGWWWAAHLALAPMAIVAVRSTSTRRLLWTGYLVGLTWWLVRLHWLWDVASGGYVALSAYMAIYVPLGLLLIRMIERRWRWPLVVIVPMVWASMEFLRGQIIAGGFNWFCLSHAIAPWKEDQGASLLLQSADLFGEWTVTFLVAMTSGMIADLFLQPWKRPGTTPPGSNRPGNKYPGPAAMSLITWLVATVAAVVYGQWRINQTPQYLSGNTARIGLVQTNTPQSNKIAPTPEQVQEDWTELLALTMNVTDVMNMPDLIVWPETMAPAALNPEALAYYKTAPTSERGAQKYANELQKLATARDTHLLIGAHAKYEFTLLTDDEGYQFVVPKRKRNSAYLIRPDGKGPFEKSDKIHRVPFGEYVPWVSNWPWLKKKLIAALTPYDFDYSLEPGEQYTIFQIPTETGPVRFATPICFEDAFSRDVLKMAYKDGQKQIDLLINLTNDGWYKGQGQRPQHFQLAVLRCVETRIPMARCVNTGLSGFIDSVGRVGPFVEKDGVRQRLAGTVVGEMAMDQRVTVFGLVGRWPIGMLVTVTFIFALAGMLQKSTLGGQRLGQLQRNSAEGGKD